MDEDLAAIADALAAECLRGSWWRPTGTGKWLDKDWRPFGSDAAVTFVGVVPFRPGRTISVAVLFRAEPHWDVVRGLAIVLDGDREDLGWPPERRRALASEQLLQLWEDIQSKRIRLDTRPTEATSTTIASVGAVHWVS